MKAKASVEKHFIRLSYELGEAMARTALPSRELRIMLWFIVRTYGVRVKSAGVWKETDAVAVSHNMIAEDTGIHRSRVKELVDHLLKLRILRAKTGGKIGINSKLGEWACAAGGRDFNRDQEPGAGALGRLGPGQSDPGQTDPENSRVGPKNSRVGPASDQNAYRECAGARARGEMSPLATVEGGEERTAPLPSSRPTATALLPNGKADTMRNRAELGHEKFAPEEHADWRTADFRRREELQAEWDAAQRQRENDRRAAEARKIADDQQKELKRMRAADAALSPEQRQANADKLAAAMRELREKRWPKQ
jgi:phage replication O-like protein O